MCSCKPHLLPAVRGRRYNDVRFSDEDTETQEMGWTHPESHRGRMAEPGFAPGAAGLRGCASERPLSPDAVMFVSHGGEPERLAG